MADLRRVWRMLAAATAKERCCGGEVFPVLGLARATQARPDLRAIQPNRTSFISACMMVAFGYERLAERCSH